jgi:hypothetical protein
MHRFLLTSSFLPWIVAVLAVACLWACAVDLGIEKKDGSDDPSGVDPVEDGDVEPDVLAEVADEPDAAAEPTCGGLTMWDVCWYLGEANESCNTTCGAHGGHSDGSAGHVGSASQGGSAEDCGTLLAALGHEGDVTAGSGVDGKGLGCHRWNDGVLYWVEDIDLDPEASHPPAQVVCGCVE